MKRFFFVASGVVLLGGSAFSRTPGAPSPAVDDTRKLAAMTTEDLISKLQETRVEGVGYDTTSVASEFIAIDDEPQFEMGMAGGGYPVTSPVMRELVRRGLSALPALLAHLTDARPTKLEIKAPVFGAGVTSLCHEYVPRHAERAKWPREVITLKAHRSDFDGGVDQYTLKVGDLCFVAVGQIVNRPLHAARYQPSGCVTVNSPVKNRELADAVKADWAGLTAAGHEQSLEQDALDVNDNLIADEALKRLFFYYPAAGGPLIVKMLNRRLSDERLVYHFVEDTLLPAGSKAQRYKAMADFHEKNGEVNYLAVLHWLLVYSNNSFAGMDETSARDKKVADDLLQRFFPDVNPVHPAFIDEADALDFLLLADALTAIHSKEIDNAVAGVLKLTPEMPVHNDPEYFNVVAKLAHACVAHLAAEPGFNRMSRQTVEKLLNEAKQLKGKSDDQNDLDSATRMLRESLASIAATQARGN